MADADVDGAHIAALLERMFVMYFPQMIEWGMVYKAIPPLYSIKEGKRSRYFTEQIDIIRFIQKAFLNKFKFCDAKGNLVDNKAVTQLFIKNADYIYHLDKVANTYAVNQYLLEMVLTHYVANKDSIKFDKLQKDIRSAFRFMDVYNEKGTIIVRGTIEKSNLIIISEKFLFDCRHILDIIRSNDNFIYKIDNKPSSIYQVMKLYESVKPSNIQRYKGLGEMDKDELAESTLYPGSDRTLIRYTMEDAKETLNAIREYESNSKKILTLVDRVTRDDLVE